MAYRTLTDSMGNVHHLPRRITNGASSTAAIHRSWAKYWSAQGKLMLTSANIAAAIAAEADDKHAYNVVIRETGITAYDFLWKQQIRQEERRHSQAA